MNDITLNTKYLEIESAYQQARINSNRAEALTASAYAERRFVSCFQFGRHVTSVLLGCLDEYAKTNTSKELLDRANGIHDDVCNNVVQTFCFTDAESTTCPCNGCVEDLDIYECLVHDLKDGYGQEGNDVKALHHALRPVADLLLAVACIEGDKAAQDTAVRIKALLS